MCKLLKNKTRHYVPLLETNQLRGGNRAHYIMLILVFKKQNKKQYLYTDGKIYIFPMLMDD